MSYDDDHRVRAGRERDANHERFDRQRMTITVTVTEEDDEGNDVEEELTFPAKFEVCSTCNGKGTHVNPSVDCDGLTSDDFAEDPDLEESYMSGTYDVTCYDCRGQRVTPAIDTEKADPDALKRYDAVVEERADYDRTCAAERRMGA